MYRFCSKSFGTGVLLCIHILRCVCYNAGTSTGAEVWVGIVMLVEYLCSVGRSIVEDFVLLEGDFGHPRFEFILLMRTGIYSYIFCFLFFFFFDVLFLRTLWVLSVGFIVTYVLKVWCCMFFIRYVRILILLENFGSFFNDCYVFFFF